MFKNKIFLSHPKIVVIRIRAKKHKVKSGNTFKLYKNTLFSLKTKYFFLLSLSFLIIRYYFVRRKFFIAMCLDH